MASTQKNRFKIAVHGTHRRLDTPLFSIFDDATEENQYGKRFAEMLGSGAGADFRLAL